MTCLTKDVIFLRACVSFWAFCLFGCERGVDVCERFDSNLFASVCRVIETIKWKQKPTRKSLVQSRTYVNRINVRDELIFGIKNWICVVAFFFNIFYGEEIHKRQTWHYTHAVLVSSCILYPDDIYRVNPCTSQPIIHAHSHDKTKSVSFFDCSVIFKLQKPCGISLKRFRTRANGFFIVPRNWCPKRALKLF